MLNYKRRDLFFPVNADYGIILLPGIPYMLKEPLNFYFLMKL
jgi:hypothetical protein